MPRKKKRTLAESIFRNEDLRCAGSQCDHVLLWKERPDCSTPRVLFDSRPAPVPPFNDGDRLCRRCAYFGKLFFFSLCSFHGLSASLSFLKLEVVRTRNAFFLFHASGLLSSMILLAAR